MAPAIVLQLSPATDVRGSLARGRAQIRWSTAFRRQRARASMEKPPKSIRGAPRDPPWRVTQDEAIDQRPFQPLHSRAQPHVGLSPHAARARRDGIDHRSRATKPLPDPIGLQIRPSLPAPALALVNGVPAAGSAEIAGGPLEQSRHASLAIGTMQPGPEPAEVASCPGHPDRLWNRLIAQFKQDPVPGQAHCRNSGPSQ